MIKIFELGDEVKYLHVLWKTWSGDYQTRHLTYVKNKTKLKSGIITGKRFMPIGEAEIGYLEENKVTLFKRTGTQTLYQVTFNLHRLPDLVAYEDLIPNGDLIFNGKTLKPMEIQ